MTQPYNARKAEEKIESAIETILEEFNTAKDNPYFSLESMKNKVTELVNIIYS